MDIEILGRTETHLLIRKDGREMVSSSYKQSGRIAYMFDTFVIKFDSGYRCDDAGYREFAFFTKDVLPDDKKYFAAVLDWGIFRGHPYIVQERIFTDEKEARNPTEEDSNLIYKLQAKYSLWDMILLSSVDAKNETYYHEIHHNISINKNHEIKIFDYSR